MNSSTNIHRKLPLFVALSILGHILFFYPISLFHTYNFAPPVMPVLTVDLKHLQTVPQSSGQPKAVPSVSPHLNKTALTTPAAVPAVVAAQRNDDAKPASEKEDRGDMGLNAPRPTAAEKIGSADPPERTTEKKVVPAAVPPVIASPRLTTMLPPPLIPPGSMMNTKREKLTYLITNHGVPVGRADLDAVTEKGDVRIALNASVSGFLGLNVTTTVFNGTNITTTIRQDAWGVNRDFGFTIALRDKLVMWVDKKTHKTGTDPIPGDDVLDLVTASYMLRRQPLEIGTPMMLHVYDYAYSSLPVEVLRREPMRLPGGKEMEALVVRPQFQQDGMFMKTSNMLVWLSDDENRVPLKIEMETGIPLIGRVTATLVHAQSEPVARADSR